MTGWLKKQKSYGNKEKVYGNQLVNFKKVEKIIGQAINDQEKIEVIKDNYPAFYLDFCSDCNLSDKTT